MTDDRTVPELFDQLDVIFDRRRLARLLDVNERAVRAWAKEEYPPNAKHRQRLERLADQVPNLCRIARGEPPIEELIV